MAKTTVDKTAHGAAVEHVHPPGSYTLRRDRTDQFRRTIQYKDGPVQLVFTPDVDIDLTQDEVDGLEKEITSGLLVLSNRDDKGRQKVIREQSPEATATIARLEKRVEELAAENSELKRQLDEATAPAK